MLSKATTVEEYLAELPDDRRVAISTVRDEIIRRLPKGYEEARRRLGRISRRGIRQRESASTRENRACDSGNWTNSHWRSSATQLPHLKSTNLSARRKK